jgi:hypothetical protein
MCLSAWYREESNRPPAFPDRPRDRTLSRSFLTSLPRERPTREARQEHQVEVVTTSAGSHLPEAEVHIVNDPARPLPSLPATQTRV